MNGLENITNDFLVGFISNSISFDTALVTKEQVQAILDNKTDGIDARITTLVNNYLDAFLYAMTLATNKTKLDENILKDIHEKIVSTLSTGGLYRNVDISIKGSNHTPPSYLKVYDRMGKYFNQLSDETADPLYNIAFSHLQLMKIHPFLDGNGRLARIILNYELVYYGYNPIYLTFDKKEEYFKLLEDFKVNKNIDSFISFIKQYL